VRTKSRDDQLKHSSNIKVITSTVWQTAMMILVTRGFYEEPVRWLQVA
jgi:hypothetical protein